MKLNKNNHTNKFKPVLCNVLTVSCESDFTITISLCICISLIHNKASCTLTTSALTSNTNTVPAKQQVLTTMNVSSWFFKTIPIEFVCAPRKTESSTLIFKVLAAGGCYLTAGFKIVPLAFEQIGSAVTCCFFTSVHSGYS